MSKCTLPRSVIALSKLAASEHQVRFGATANVKISASSGNFRAEATNGRLFGIINGYAEGEIDILIDAKKMAEIQKVLAKEHDRIVIETQHDDEPGSRPTFTAGGIKPQVVKPDGPVPDPDPLSKIGGEYPLPEEAGRWPNTNQVIPSGKVACRFMVDAHYLIDLLNVAIKVHGGDCVPVTFTVFQDSGVHKKPICLTACNEEKTQVYDAVLVPLVDAK